MTQYEFDPLPLLLPAREAQMVLAGVKRDDFYASRDDGTLRGFQPDPQHAFAYYLKADIGRMAGLNMDATARRIAALPDQVSEFQFKFLTGLSDHAIATAILSQQLKPTLRNGGREYARGDLSAWVLTREAEPVKS